MNNGFRNEKPIGVFDSGLGGLTALSELRRLMPNEDIVYFGDSARIPYGTKSPSVIKKFALQDTRFLLSKGVKAILVACGTVSSNCLNEVYEEAGVSVVGVIEAAAKRAAEIAKGGNGLVAVLGTNATVNSGAFEKALNGFGISEVISVACPMFVPLVENWHPSVDDGATNAIVSEYLLPIAAKKPSAVILGCTHYPLLEEVIKKYLPESVLISSGAVAAEELKALVSKLSIENSNGGATEFYTSGGAEMFVKNAGRFLKDMKVEAAEQVDIERFE
ncbi:MAG: glutamate racemase [Clostridia bacterium]|nr:glutamate racemase [Clostridia bacterium]